MSSIGTAIMQATGEQILELAHRHVGEKYTLGVLVPKNNPKWTGPWDCAEFASWAVFQASESLYGCDRIGHPVTADAFTGFWERDARSLGELISIDQAAGIAGCRRVAIPPSGSNRAHRDFRWKGRYGRSALECRRRN